MLLSRIPRRNPKNPIGPKLMFETIDNRTNKIVLVDGKILDTDGGGHTSKEIAYRWKKDYRMWRWKNSSGFKAGKSVFDHHQGSQQGDSQENPQEVPQLSPQGIPPEFPQRIPQEAPQLIPPELPQRIPQEVPQVIPEDDPQDIDEPLRGIYYE